MRLELSPFVERDLEDIAAWIARDNPGRAVTFIKNKLRFETSPFRG